MVKLLTRQTGRSLLLCCLLLGAWLPASVQAASSESRYIKISKDMVVNYGDPSLGRLKYLKFAVQLRVENALAADIVAYHQPALLDAMVMLFSAQTDAAVRSVEGKEDIRQRALLALRDVMTREEGEGYIQDLLFTRFVIQR